MIVLDELTVNIQNSDYVAKQNLVIFSARCALTVVDKFESILGEDYNAVVEFLNEPDFTTDIASDLYSLIRERMVNARVDENGDLVPLMNLASLVVMEAIDTAEAAFGGSVDLTLEYADDLLSSLKALNCHKSDTMALVDSIYVDMLPSKGE